MSRWGSDSEVCATSRPSPNPVPIGLEDRDRELRKEVESYSSRSPAAEQPKNSWLGLEDKRDQEVSAVPRGWS